MAALGELSLGGQKVEAKRQALVQKIGENIAIRRFARIATAAKLAQYVHGGQDRRAGRIRWRRCNRRRTSRCTSRSPSPSTCARKDVPADVVAREREILDARAHESGKPAEIVAKMVEGGINKFLGEITLLGQPFVKDDKQTVEKMLAARRAKLLDYRFFVVGEGIEKKSE